VVLELSGQLKKKNESEGFRSRNERAPLEYIYCLMFTRPIRKLVFVFDHFYNGAYRYTVLDK